MSFVKGGNNDLPPPYNFAAHQSFESRLAQEIQESAPVLINIAPKISRNISPIYPVHGVDYSLSSPRVTSTIHQSLQPLRNITWIDCSNGDIPPNSVLAGCDKDNSPLYAGAAWLENELLPAKISPSHGCAYVSSAGNEIRLNVYKVMCSNYVVWKNCSYGNVPQGAIECGFTVNGEKLYLGRCQHDGALTVGKIHPSHRCLYIPYDGKELSFNNYEVAVLKNPVTEAPLNVARKFEGIHTRAENSKGVSAANGIFFFVFSCVGIFIFLAVVSSNFRL